MSDNNRNGSPEHIAYLLATQIAKSNPTDSLSGRDNFLDLYAECLKAAQGDRILKS